jgi:hypothetical protein
MINCKKKIELRIIDFILLLGFILITILLFFKKSCKSVNNCNKYIAHINRLEAINKDLMEEIKSSLPSIGNHNSSHSSNLTPSYY